MARRACCGGKACLVAPHVCSGACKPKPKPPAPPRRAPRPAKPPPRRPPRRRPPPRRPPPRRPPSPKPHSPPPNLPPPPPKLAVRVDSSNAHGMLAGKVAPAARSTCGVTLEIRTTRKAATWLATQVSSSAPDMLSPSVEARASWILAPAGYTALRAKGTCFKARITFVKVAYHTFDDSPGQPGWPQPSLWNALEALFSWLTPVSLSGSIGDVQQLQGFAAAVAELPALHAFRRCLTRADMLCALHKAVALVLDKDFLAAGSKTAAALYFVQETNSTAFDLLEQGSEGLREGLALAARIVANVNSLQNLANAASDLERRGVSEEAAAAAQRDKLQGNIKE